MKKIAVVIPACNEEAYITLPEGIKICTTLLLSACGKISSSARDQDSGGFRQLHRFYCKQSSAVGNSDDQLSF